MNKPNQLSLFSDEEMGVQPGYIKPGNRQPTYPVDHMVTYTRLSDGKQCYHPVMFKPMEVFLSQARAIWGNRYDYSNSKYTGNKEPIFIFCPKHQHEFRVAMAQNHIIKPRKGFKPTGCPICAAENLYKREFGPDWNTVLKLSAKKNHARLIAKPGKKKQLSPEELAACDARKAEEKRQREEQRRLKKEARAIQVEQERLQRIEDNHKAFAAKFINKMSVINPDLQFKNLPVNMHAKITAICSNHGEITHEAKWFLSGKGCEYCNGKFYAPFWKKYARAVHGDKYQYVGDAPKTKGDIIHYICKDHGLIEQRYDVHVDQSCECPKCKNYPNNKSPLQRCQEWIDKCIAKYGEGRYDYSRAHEDYVNNDSLVWIRCCIHDLWFQTTPDNNLRKTNGSCPICSLDLIESEGERVVRKWLEDHNIEHETQHQLPNNDATLPLQYLVADFYLPDVDRQPVIIEYNGRQHYEDIDFYYRNQRIRSFEVQQHRDRYLRQYCSEHQIRLLEIPYTDFDNIDTILTDFFGK